MSPAISRVPSLSFSERTDESVSSPVTPDQSQMLDQPQRPSLNKAAGRQPPPSSFNSGRVPANRPVSSFSPARSRLSLPSILQTAGVLKRLLPYLTWIDFRSLSKSSKGCRNLIRNIELRDIILARFIQGYRVALAQSDMATFRDVPFGFRDLELFMSSQRLPLHNYPTLALSILSVLLPTTDQEIKSEHYAALCIAHSRAVLLLQSLVHSSNLPVMEDPDDFRFQLRTSDIQFTNKRSVRELVFPAPLSYFTPPPAPVANPDPKAPSRRASMSPLKSKPSKKFFSRSATHIPQMDVEPETVSQLEARRPSSAKSRVRSKAHSRVPSVPSAADFLEPHKSYSTAPSRRSSVFGTVGGSSKSRAPPPLPTNDTMGLKTYAGSWRRRRESISMSDSEEFLFRRPLRHFASTTPTSGSSRSSFDGSPSPVSREPAPQGPLALTGPHDIRLATSRLRAPILHVFHPCADLDEAAIEACEDQLDDAGLWTHLSTGDIVCNLGWIPPEDSAATGSTSSSEHSNGDGAALWLLFDGARLLPFSFTDPLPLTDPLGLPSPLYYLHITPPGVSPRLRFALPPQQDVQLTLTSLPTTVRSPHSPRGIARTVRYAWIARVRAQQRENLGAGWQGMWVLEGEGTKEGREQLVRALSAGMVLLWEMVAEKTSAGQLWLRLIS